MKLRKIVLVLLGLCALPKAASAGLIDFTISSNLTYTSPLPVAESGLLGTQYPPGPLFAFNPATSDPAWFYAVQYDPKLLPTPPAGTVKPNQTVYWNLAEAFTVNVTLTDMSGHSATVALHGNAYLDNFYSPGYGSEWFGQPTFWFQDWQRFTLDGQTYTIWGANFNTVDYSYAVVDVWVGSGAPPMPQWTPEPGTFALAALGLIPLGFRGLRRMW